MVAKCEGGRLVEAGDLDRYHLGGDDPIESIEFVSFLSCTDEPCPLWKYLCPGGLSRD